jgi:hypothetical protein
VDSSFGALDAFAFVVFAVLIFVGVIVVVNLGKLPGQLARRQPNSVEDDPNRTSIMAGSRQPATTQR